MEENTKVMEENKADKIDGEIKKRLFIVGSSHIATESVKNVNLAFESFRPEIIAVELDRRRFETLFYKGKRKAPPISYMFKIGLFGYLFTLLGGYLQRTLGARIGTTPGIEMKTAAKLAAENNIPLALIDQDIEITLKNLSKQAGVLFILKVIYDMIAGGIKTLFTRKKQIDLEPFDLKSVPNERTIKKILKLFKSKYPKLYKALVEDRNIIMAEHLSSMILSTDKKIMAVVGAGHKQELYNLIKQKIKTGMINSGDKK